MPRHALIERRHVASTGPTLHATNAALASRSLGRPRSPRHIFKRAPRDADVSRALSVRGSALDGTVVVGQACLLHRLNLTFPHRVSKKKKVSGPKAEPRVSSLWSPRPATRCSSFSACRSSWSRRWHTDGVASARHALGGSPLAGSACCQLERRIWQSKDEMDAFV